MERDKNRRCKDCAHFHDLQFSHSHKVGECRIDPPHGIFISSSYMEGQWPRVDEFDWCSKWSTPIVVVTDDLDMNFEIRKGE